MMIYLVYTEQYKQIEGVSCVYTKIITAFIKEIDANNFCKNNLHQPYFYYIKAIELQ
jgi:hypothetical protein